MTTTTRTCSPINLNPLWKLKLMPLTAKLLGQNAIMIKIGDFHQVLGFNERHLKSSGREKKRKASSPGGQARLSRLGWKKRIISSCPSTSTSTRKQSYCRDLYSKTFERSRANKLHPASSHQAHETSLPPSRTAS